MGQDFISALVNKAAKAIVFWVLVVLTLAEVGYVAVDHYASQPAHPLIVQGPVRVLPAPPTFRSYVDRMVAQSPTKMSPTRREILSEQLARIAESTFASRDHQEAFVLLVAIESAYNTQARSSTGALGLTQVMPKYASSFAKVCGLGDVGAEDLLDAEVNLRVGACQFRELLKTFNGNIGLSLSAYNSGAQSKTTKGLAQGHGTDNLETSNYLAKFLILKEKNK